MTFQISKLRSMIPIAWQNWFRTNVLPRLIMIFLWCHDLYVDTRAGAYKLFVRLLVYLFMGKTYLGSDLLLATGHESGRDLTSFVKLFYRFDRIISVASLYRWLAKFDNRDRYINLVFYRGNILMASRIDLDTDIEMITMSDIPNGDLILMKLPAHPVHTLSQNI